MNLEYIKDKLLHLDAKEFFLKTNLYYVLAVILFLCFSIGSMITLGQSYYQLKEHNLVTTSKHSKVQSMEDFFLNNTLFGAYNDEELTALSSKSPEALGLTLVGIMFSTNAKLSNAILQNSEGKEYIVYVGEKIDDDIIVEKIEPDMVSLRFNGSLQRLVLPKDPLEFSTLEDFITDNSEDNTEEPQ